MTKDFYRAFEDRYRGSREMIKERLRAYLPFVVPLASATEGAAALDLGCGRGEWLELLGEHAFAARGVDLDDGMLAACREQGLSVENADAIDSLRALPDNSLAVVSAFHLVEHIPFDVLRELIGQALRVLQPGGLLIMETPNPENPAVGACRFYLDPSHLRPLPPNLLSFLTEYAGFVRQKVVRLQEDPQLHTPAAIRLINVLDGASPDYSVIAQKSAPADVLERFDLPFEREFGITIGELAQRFEDGQRAPISALAELQQRHADELARTAASFHQQTAELSARLAETYASIPKLEASLAQADDRSTELAAALSRSDLRLAQCEARIAESSLRITEVHAQLAIIRAQKEQQCNMLSGELAEARLRAADAEASLIQKKQELANAHMQLNAVFASTSWRFTAPLRWIGSLFRSGR